MEEKKENLNNTVVASEMGLPSVVDVPDEYVEKVVAEMEAMRKAYIATVHSKLNHRKNIAAKRKKSAKNAKKMRKIQRKHRK